MSDRIIITLLCLTLLLAGCTNKEVQTFAGFTFGGGGNTFSAEPCQLTVSGSSGHLIAGQEGQDTFLELHWTDAPEAFSPTPISLAKATVSVASKGRASTLKEGHIVLQARDGQIGHGSFDLTGKLEDGREVNIVGSFTANIEP